MPVPNARPLPEAWRYTTFARRLAMMDYALGGPQGLVNSMVHVETSYEHRKAAHALYTFLCGA